MRFVFIARDKAFGFDIEPRRDAVAPPELAGNGPVLDVLQPVAIGVDPVWRHELHFARLDQFETALGEVVHLHEPLVGEEGLDDGAGTVAVRHGVDMGLDLLEQVLILQALDDHLARGEAEHAVEFENRCMELRRQLDTFGERVSAEIPTLANIEFSLREIRDWQPIGTFNDGRIEIPLEDGNVVHIHNAGIGPEGFSKGGPFTVFGAISEAQTQRADAIESAEEFLPERYPADRATAIIEAIKQSPYTRLTQQTVGSDSQWSDALSQRIDFFNPDTGCGDR